MTLGLPVGAGVSHSLSRTQRPGTYSGDVPDTRSWTLDENESLVENGGVEPPASFERFTAKARARPSRTSPKRRRLGPELGAVRSTHVTRWGAKNGSHSSGIVPRCQTGETSGSERG